MLKNPIAAEPSPRRGDVCVRKVLKLTHYLSWGSDSF